MGESREGEGRSAATTTDDLVALLAGQVMMHSSEIESVVLSRLTSGRYQVLVQEHGSNDAEEFLVGLDDDDVSVEAASPIGGDIGETDA